MKFGKKSVSRKTYKNKDTQPKDFSLRHKIVNGKGLLRLEGKISSRVTLVLEPVIKKFQKKVTKLKR